MYAIAIYGGAPAVAQYILQYFGITPDQDYAGLSHIELSILSKRTQIISVFLSSDATINPAREAGPSGLHLAGTTGKWSLCCVKIRRREALSERS